MAKSLKSKALNTTSTTNLPAVVVEKRKKEKEWTAEASASLCDSLIDKAHKAINVHNQSGIRTEQVLHDALYASYVHVVKFGDVSKCERLVVDIPIGRESNAWRAEALKWFKKNSPIYFDKDGKCHLAKEGEPNYAPWNVERAESEPFFDMPEAKEARTKAAKLHKDMLDPITYNDFRKRIFGLRKWFDKAQEKDKDGNIRGITPSDKAKLERGIAHIEKAFTVFDKNPLQVVKNEDKQEESLKSETKVA